MASGDYIIVEKANNWLENINTNPLKSNKLQNNYSLFSESKSFLCYCVRL